jgi:hypothetical protein
MSQKRQETQALALAALVLALQAGCGSSDAPKASTSGATGFSTRREHAVDAKPTALLARDLDLDGRPELVATDAERGEIRVWRGDAPWNAGSARVVPVGGWPLAPVVLPSRGKARPLVAVASRARRDLTLLDLFAPAPGNEVRRVDLPAAPRALAAGDLGADGAFDLAVACDGGRLALVGAEGEPRVVAIEDGLPRCALVLADGSGVVLGYQDRRGLVVVETTGPGRVEREITLGGIPRALIESDLDGDGDLELACAGGDGSIWVLGFGEPGGSGAWRRHGAPPPIAWTADAIPIDLASADLDRDGREELVWLAYHDLSWTVAGGFARTGPARHASGYAGQTPCALALLDRDGDGKLDLAIANRDSRSISLARGLGADGFATPAKVPVGRFPTALLAGDLDRDGRADLVVLESKDDTAAVLANRGGKLERGLVLATGPDPRAACLHDLDGDCRLDLALVADDPEGSRVRIWFGGDGGALAPRPGVEDRRVGSGVVALLAADLDGDGRADLLAADAERGEVVWLRERPITLAVRDGPRALAAIQLDADPALEVAVALGGSGTSTGVALLDAVEGELREIARIDTGGPAVALAPADLDQDGLEDLAVLVLAGNGASDGEVKAYLRAGASEAARLRLAGSFATSSHPRAIAAGDLDRDGLPDVVVAAQYAHRVDYACSRRAAKGVPWRFEPQDALGAGVGCMDVVISDLDRDGALDVAVANGHSDDVTILSATGR